MNHTVFRGAGSGYRMPHLQSAPAAAAMLLMTACASAPPDSSASRPETPLAQTVATAPPNQTGGSALSYGSVTAAVVKGQTTQIDLIQMFGGPNISTIDSEGVETWIYERSVSQTDVASKSQNFQAAANLGVAFGHVQAGGGASGGQASAGSSMATSFRSLTAIVKFNTDRTVKDYSVRATQF